MAMNRLASRNFTVCVLVLIFSATNGQQSQCEDHWFGDKCQYQCHCLNDAVCDKTTGECPDGCDARWFGPQCQYFDAAFNLKAYLTDGSGILKCLVGDGLFQNFQMLDNVTFTWMRIVTSRSGLFDQAYVNITFLSSSGAEVVPKSPLTRINLTDTVHDIYGELQDRFKTIRLNFDTAETRRSFCSMQVSSGRNVAIKQNVSQSSTDENYVAEKAVDGKSNQTLADGSCSATDAEESAYWTLNLSIPVTVNMYTILGRSDAWALCRLRFFRLESYYESTEVLQYVKTDTAEKTSYDVYPVGPSTITSVTLTVSKDLWPNNSFDCYLGLSFCEMQIYGDVVCRNGKWGRDCEKACNCQNPNDSCFVSTGMCPSGCKAGFQGHGCQQCEDGWFGDKCQYQCHCLNNAVCDKTTGECPDGCDVRWFGPQCQYVDAAYNTDNYLTDGNESTCLDNDFKTQTFNMSYDVMFSWMRVVTKEKGQFDRVNITFLSRNGTEVDPSSPLRRIFLSETTLDLHGELQDRFKSIKLDFVTSETSRLFCSMQVSLGRNVAIKQNASQSSTNENYVAEKGVDGKPNQSIGEGSCMATNTEDSPYWTLNLSLHVTVNMYRILGRSDAWALCRLRYFRLESSFESTEVLQYVKKNTAEQFSYIVFPEGSSTITSVTLTVSKDLWPNNYFDCNNGKLGLSFCEMQIYGDVVCQPGKWGRECEKDCNCQDLCYVSTGMCPCKAGFRGPGCQEECEEGQWGLDCLNRCDNCIDRKCNKSSGECLSGCVRGYKIPFCVEECDAGFHGYNCNQTCSENCLNTTCNNVDGTCIQCVPGYQGPVCDQAECDVGFHGYNCNQTCPENCLNKTCDNIDGRCIQCKAGYQGPVCEQECEEGKWGLDCLNRCDNCIDKKCNKRSGECLSGCVRGYKMPSCVEECDIGFHGYNCIYFCPENCRNNTCDHVHGLCVECEAGYQGSLCVQECDPTFYGENCASSCSHMCIDQLCHHITGVCYKCPYGKQISKDCSQECPAGFHGYNCYQSCPVNCRDNVCNNLDGICVKCVAGYQGPVCNQVCDATFYGEDCATRCSDMCIDRLCHHITGVCYSCPDGKQISKDCSSDSDDLNLVMIVIPIILGLIVFAALIFGFCFYRRRKAQQAGKDEVVDDQVNNRQDVVHEHHEVHLELENQPSNQQVPVTDHYETISLNLNEVNQNINENDSINPYVNENEEIPQYEKIGTNEYDSINPYVNENEEIPQYERIGTNVRETGLYDYSEPETGNK